MPAITELGLLTISDTGVTTTGTGGTLTTGTLPVLILPPPLPPPIGTIAWFYNRKALAASIPSPLSTIAPIALNVAQ
jgi:hypothetical protein